MLYFLEAKEDLDSPEIASIMAQGSYACLYLINSFSSLLQSAESLSEILGLSERVLQLRRLISRATGCNEQNITEQWSVENKNNISTSNFVLRNLLIAIFGTWRRDNVSPEDFMMNEYMTLGAGEAEFSDPEAAGKVSLLNVMPHPVQPMSFSRPDSSYQEDVLIYIDNLCLETPLGVPLTKALSLEVSIGDRVHVSGPIGCGKTTLMKYIAASFHSIITTRIDRFRDCSFSSELSTLREFEAFNNPDVEITNANMEIALRKFGVFQDVVFVPDVNYFFDGSLMENVLYPLTRDELLKKNSNVFSGTETKMYAFLEKSTEKLLQELGLNHLLLYESKSREKMGKSSIDWSSVLSNGERSLLSVARALLKKPTLLIFDNFPLIGAENILKLMKEYCDCCIVTSSMESCELLSGWCNKEILLGEQQMDFYNK